jgi:flagellar biosynthetic protein FlhB
METGENRDDRGEATEPASERRRAMAKAEGRFVPSRDLVAVTSIAVAVVLCRYHGKSLLAWISGSFRSATEYAWEQRGLDIASASLLCASTLEIVVVSVAPLVIVVALVAFLAGSIQTRFSIDFSRLAPSGARFASSGAWRRMLSLRGVFAVTFVVAKLGVAILGVGEVWRLAESAELVVHSVAPIGSTASMMARVEALSVIALDVATRLAVAVFIIAIGDFASERFLLSRDLRMTRDEVEAEARDGEMDPAVRDRARELRRRIASTSGGASESSADISANLLHGGRS